MHTSTINALEQYAGDYGLPGIPETIDTDECDCEPCVDEARAEIRTVAQAYAEQAEGDREAAKWDAEQEQEREVAYYERLAFSNPEDDATREAQRWYADYHRSRPIYTPAQMEQLATDAA